MPLKRVDRQTDNLDAPLVELRLDPGHVAKLGRAHWREVLGVREQDGPGIADPVVEANFAIGRLRLEIRRRIIEGECHLYLLDFGRKSGLQGASLCLISAPW